MTEADIIYAHAITPTYPKNNKKALEDLKHREEMS